MPPHPQHSWGERRRIDRPKLTVQRVRLSHSSRIRGTVIWATRVFIKWTLHGGD